MDQKIIAAGGKLTGIILFFCAFIVIPLGLGMAFSYPDKIWVLGPVLLVCGAVFIRSGISNLKQSARMQKQSDAEMRNIGLQVEGVKRQLSSEDIQVNESDAVNDVKILARWTYTTAQWKQYTAWETKKRSFNSTVEALLVVVLGTVVVHLLRRAPWGLSFGISTAIAIIYWLGKFFLSMASIGKSRTGLNEVIILHNAVIINGKYNPVRSELYYLNDVSIDEKSKPMIMEIVYGWQTRKGPTTDEIRIPIPEGALDEARDVAAALRW